jgi:hypothetical protein
MTYQPNVSRHHFASNGNQNQLLLDRSFDRNLSNIHVYSFEHLDIGELSSLRDSPANMNWLRRFTVIGRTSYMFGGSEHKSIRTKGTCLGYSPKHHFNQFSLYKVYQPVA